jgi:hypothetical protein
MFTSCPQNRRIGGAYGVMPEGSSEQRRRRAAQSAPLALCLVLAGCTSTVENQVTFFADPGKYEFYNCKQLADARNTMSARQQELKGLIDRAEQSASGVLVGAIAYRSDYIAAGEDIKVIDATARSKNCAATPAWRSNGAIQ